MVTTSESPRITTSESPRITGGWHDQPLSAARAEGLNRRLRQPQFAPHHQHVRKVGDTLPRGTAEERNREVHTAVSSLWSSSVRHPRNAPAPAAVWPARRRATSRPASPPPPAPRPRRRAPRPAAPVAAAAIRPGLPDSITSAVGRSVTAGGRYPLSRTGSGPGVTIGPAGPSCAAARRPAASAARSGTASTTSPCRGSTSQRFLTPPQKPPPQPPFTPTRLHAVSPSCLRQRSSVPMAIAVPLTWSARVHSPCAVTSVSTR